MAITDIVIIIVFAVAVISGFRKGLIAQIGSLAAIIVAIIACRFLGPSVTDMILGRYGSDPSLWQRFTASAMSYCGIYIIAYYAVVLVARLFRKVASIMMLGPLDSIGGAVLSVFKWGMALSIAANLYIALFPSGGLLTSSCLCGGRAITSITKLAPAVLGQINRLCGPMTEGKCNDQDSSAKVSEDETR